MDRLIFESHDSHSDDEIVTSIKKRDESPVRIIKSIKSPFFDHDNNKSSNKE